VTAGRKESQGEGEGSATARQQKGGFDGEVLLIGQKKRLEKGGGKHTGGGKEKEGADSWKRKRMETPCSR